MCSIQQTGCCFFFFLKMSTHAEGSVKNLRLFVVRYLVTRILGHPFCTLAAPPNPTYPLPCRSKGSPTLVLCLSKVNCRSLIFVPVKLWSQCKSYPKFYFSLSCWDLLIEHVYWNIYVPVTVRWQRNHLKYNFFLIVFKTICPWSGSRHECIHLGFIPSHFGRWNFLPIYIWIFC